MAKKKATKKGIAPKKVTPTNSNSKGKGKDNQRDTYVIPTGTKTDLTKLKNPAKYMTFVMFTAIPTVQRGEILGADTQKELAKQIGVGEDTLVDWKKVIGFWEDVTDIRKGFFKDKTADVLLSLYNTCLKEGRGHDVKVFLNYTGELTDKNETEHTVTPELQKALEKVAKVLG